MGSASEADPGAQDSDGTLSRLGARARHRQPNMRLLPSFSVESSCLSRTGHRAIPTGCEIDAAEISAAIGMGIADYQSIEVCVARKAAATGDLMVQGMG